MQTEKPAHKSGQFLLGGDRIVYRLGFGAMRVTGPGIWGAPSNYGEAVSLLRRVLDLGINFIDTADSYGPYISETLLAEALYPYPNDLVIATKGGLVRPGPDQWVSNGDPDHLRSACEGSLKRLRLECIDLYQLHRIDARVPWEAQIEALALLQQEGKIRHIGLSEVTVDEIKKICAMVKIVSVQNKYNLLDRRSEDVLDYCTKENIAFIPWYPLATGSLTKPGDASATIANKLGARPAQVALAWLLNRSKVILPIPGTSSIKHLEENTQAALVKLDRPSMQALDGPFAYQRE
jgi:aryl-alcohol dehydrogenase-like predicted oxidoreductase